MILHVDMDAFYASVEVRDRPELAGRAVIVGGSPEGRGVVAAANYIARRYGVHSAMPAATAVRLCPHAVLLPSRMSHYGAVSQQIRTILHRYTPLVEPLSLDEAFLDVTGSRRLFGPAEQIAGRIKHDIRDELHLVASVGVAPNKFLAKIASDLRKPDGFVVVQPGTTEAFLDPLPVERIWGVGSVAAERLHRMGVRTIAQLRALSPETLTSRFGSSGEHLWLLARGIDERPVVPDQQAKSISQETTFAVDVEGMETVRSWLLELTQQVSSRLRSHNLRARTVHIKIRFSDFRTITRSLTMSKATEVTAEIWQAVSEILQTRLPSELPPMRLLGMGLSGLGCPEKSQASLFDQQEHEKQCLLDTATDRIKQRFGASALRRASRPPSPGERPV